MTTDDEVPGVDQRLTITNARLEGREDLVSLAVDDGTISSIGPASTDGGATLDAGGSLVLPAFVDGHLHVCKAYTRDLAGDRAAALYSGEGMASGPAADAIDVAAAVKSAYDDEVTYLSTRHALLSGVKHGVRLVQAFADVDTAAGLAGVRGALRARDELADLITARVVAFPQDGLLRDPGAEDLVRQAVELGADVVGGIPWIEGSEADQREHVQRMVRVAAEHDLPVAMLVDDAGDPSLRTLEMLAHATIEHGLQGRVVACHARALGTYPQEYFDQLVELLLEARIGVVTDPHTGATFLRAVELRERGVPVALGQDDIADAYYPYGQHNMLEVAFLASHLWRRFDSDGQHLVTDMVTAAAGTVLGDGRRVVEGAPADLVVTGQPSVVESLRYHLPPSAVVRAGRVVARSATSTEFPTSPDATAVDLLTAVPR